MSPARRSCRDVRYRAAATAPVGCPTQEGPPLHNQGSATGGLLQLSDTLRSAGTALLNKH